MAVKEFTTEELANEIWKDVVGYEGIYSVSNLGRIRRDKPPARGTNTYVGYILSLRALRRAHSNQGRCDYTVKLTKNGKVSTLHVGRLVAAAFLGPCPLGLELNHIDGDSLNNRPENLEYITRLENIRHAKRLDLCPIGSRAGAAKLTESDIPIIRTLFWEFSMRQAEIALLFGVGQTIISNIAHRKKWTHVA